MYALAARDLYAAKTLENKVDVLQKFTKKVASKRPQYDEFEPPFLDLRFSSKLSKQKNLVRYTLMKIQQKNSTGMAFDPNQMTIEHLAPENPSKSSNLTDEDIASIGNLILVDQDLNNELANKTFPEKVAILKAAHVWVDPIVLNATKWGAEEIVQRGKLLSKDAYENVWPL